MRRAFAATVGCALAAAAAAGAARPAPIIALQDRQTVAGARFASSEWVTVRFGTRAVRVHASRTGRFVVGIGPLVVSRCGAAQIRAVGARGDVAVLKIPLPACLPERTP